MRKVGILSLVGAGVGLVLAALATGPNFAGPKSQPSGDRAAAPAFAWPDGKKAALSLTFDDARTTQVDNGLPLFGRLGVKVTFYVSPDGVKERLDGWKRAVKDGHEIGNHTVSHPCTANYTFSKDNALEDYTLDRIAREIDEAEKFITETLGVKAASFAYPCCQTFVGRGRQVKSYVPLVAERFENARLGGNEAANDPLVCDLSQLLAEGSDGASFEDLKALVDGAVSEGRWLILCGHEIADAGYQTTSMKTLEALCKYATDPGRGVWVDTVSRVARHVARSRQR